MTIGNYARRKDDDDDSSDYWRKINNNNNNNAATKTGATEDRNKAYAFVVNSFKNLINPLRGKWTTTTTSLLPSRGKKRQKGLKATSKGEDHLANSFFSRDQSWRGVDQNLVLKRKDFLQVSGQHLICHCH